MIDPKTVIIILLVVFACWLMFGQRHSKTNNNVDKDPESMDKGKSIEPATAIDLLKQVHRSLVVHGKLDKYTRKQVLDYFVGEEDESTSGDTKTI